MKLCSFCPKGEKCSGHVLHTVLIKLYDAMKDGDSSDELIKVLPREDLLTLANKGAEAKEACWCKSFVLSVAQKFVELAERDISLNQLLPQVEDMIEHMDRLFSNLPKGSAIDLSALTLDIHNQACADLEDLESSSGALMHVISQACLNVSRREQN